MSTPSLGTVGAVVAAAGRGERLGLATPKALQTVAGQPMVRLAVRALAAAAVDLVVVAAPAGWAGEVEELVATDHDGADLVVVEGGASRSDSVRAALRVLPPSVEVVVVHDAARPLAPSYLVDAVIAAVRAGADAVVPGLPISDTVKQVDVAGTVISTLDRSALRAVQTPQGFRRAVLEAAYAGEAGPDATDDAGHVERAGGLVAVIPGADEAFKVTRPIDLALAEALAADRADRHG